LLTEVDRWGRGFIERFHFLSQYPLAGRRKAYFLKETSYLDGH
jgi:hypothetical protein